ncbi:hypothetical protein [Schlesneria sp.]|uniref:hypothetical protein n=1 Tax=Schlesneria sp. TaxID=2762018 RepID=UPI002F22081C
MFQYKAARLMAPIVMNLLGSSIHDPMWIMRTMDDRDNPDYHDLYAIVQSKQDYTVGHILIEIEQRWLSRPTFSARESQVVDAESLRSRIIVSRLETMLLENKVARRILPRQLYDGGGFSAFYMKGAERSFFSPSHVGRNAFKESACGSLVRFVVKTIKNHRM